MKKVITFVKKYDNLIIILMLLTFLSAKIYNVSISNNDELINFLNIYKMANGLTIYKDMNVIITPLFFYIGKIIFEIFPQNLLIFRTYNLIISTILYFLVYQILKALKINKKLSLLYTLIIMKYTYSIVGAGANYNILSYCFCELGLLLILKMKENNKKDILQGIIVFLIFFTNQKLAAGYFIALIIYNIVNKNIKSIVKEMLILGMLSIIYFFYLYTQGNLYNFIDYTILGIGEFAIKNIAIDATFLPFIIFAITPIFTLIIDLILLKIIKEKEQTRNLKTMLIFSLGVLIIIIPIINYYHLALANILMFISLIYSLNYLITPLIDEKYMPKVFNLLIVIFIIIMGIETIVGMKNYYKVIKMIDNKSPLYGGYIEEETKKEIEEVSKYIKNNTKNTIVLSTMSPFYSIQLNDLNNKVYDWALRGNLGKEGEKGLIEKIKQLENTQILLYKPNEQDSEIYQFAYGAVEYIKENMKLIGKIGSFGIYETN